jgi:D-alanyl-D-alanine carboxypeptidase/D-alanyl-D-alanine-endopeptidase (penicillin-binding protein 4)
MHFAVTLITVIFLFSFTFCSHGLTKKAVSSSHSRTVPKAISIDQIIQQASPKALIGVRVEDAKTGKVVFAHNDLRLFKPASTTKLFTAAASLHSLGPNYKYRTQLISDQAVHNGHLKQLYVLASGDPSLRTADLNKMAKELFKQGLRTVERGLIIDTSRFEGPEWAPGWTVDGLNWYYYPPISATTLDENTVGLTLSQSNPKSANVKAYFQDRSLPFPIRGSLAAVSERGSKLWCELILHFGKENALDISGCWPRQAQTSTLQVAIRDTVHHFHFRLRQALLNAGIHIPTHYRLARLPEHPLLLSEHSSKPLSLLLKPLLEDSNNLYAESLLKTIGWQEHRVGSFQGGVNALKEVLQNNLAVNLKHIRLKDGSGGSHYNLASPKHLTQLLHAMKNSVHADAFFKALPRSGYTGTLKYRLSDPTHRGRFLAKTGTITGSATLAGLVRTHKGRELVFAVMVDQTTLTSRQARHLIDRICQQFMNY